MGLGIVDKFCCCIPLRAGVFIIALFLLAEYLSCLLVLIVKKNAIFNLFTASWTPIVYYITLALAATYSFGAFFGLAGSMWASRVMVTIFNIINWIMVLLSLVLSFGFWIFTLMHRQDIINECVAARNGTASATGSPLTLADATDGTAADCDSEIRAFIVYTGIGVCLGGLFSIYFASVIRSYVVRLKRKNHRKLRDFDEVPSNIRPAMGRYVP